MIAFQVRNNNPVSKLYLELENILILHNYDYHTKLYILYSILKIYKYT